jgi:hypothetical protein
MSSDYVNIPNDMVPIFVGREGKVMDIETVVTRPVLEQENFLVQLYSFIRMHRSQTVFSSISGIRKPTRSPPPFPQRSFSSTYEAPARSGSITSAFFECSQSHYVCVIRHVNFKPCHKLSGTNFKESGQVQVIIHRKKGIQTWRYFEPFYPEICRNLCTISIEVSVK